MVMTYPLRSIAVSLVVVLLVTSCGQRSAAALPNTGSLAIDRTHTALLVMDLQQGIIGLGGSGVQDAIAHTSAAERASRRAGVGVVFVETGFTPGYPEVSPRNKTFAALASTGKMLDGSPETRPDPRIAPVGREPVVVKHDVGAFSTPKLREVLQDKHIDTLVLTGLATSGVVLATAETAEDLDYRVIVLSDCVADLDPEVNRVLLDKVLPTRADVVDYGLYAKALR
jgi:nicotinamidase-related amidase